MGASRRDTRRPVALQRVDHREIPREHIDAQVVPPGGQRVQERRERVGERVVGAARREPHPAVDVPADDEHRMACAQRGAQRRKYASPSTSIVKRSAARIVSQLRPRSSRPCRGSRSPAWRRRSPRRRVVRSATVIGYRPPGRRRGASAAHRAHQCPPPGRMRIEPCAFAGAAAAAHDGDVGDALRERRRCVCDADSPEAPALGVMTRRPARSVDRPAGGEPAPDRMRGQAGASRDKRANGSGSRETP